MTIREKVARAIDPGAFKEQVRSSHDRRPLAKMVATAAITAFLEAAAEEGWHMRPDEATGAMEEAGMGEDGPNWPVPSWRAMCKAAPEFEWNDK